MLMRRSRGNRARPYGRSGLLPISEVHPRRATRETRQIADDANKLALTGCRESGPTENPGFEIAPGSRVGVPAKAYSAVNQARPTLLRLLANSFRGRQPSLMTPHRY